MARALIGWTGFVGGTLDRQAEFSHRYNSKNVEDLAGQAFELVVCAGAPAVKWLANKEPEADRASLARLRGALDASRAREVVLISTVDVYPTPIEVDEDTPVARDGGQPYGRHRLELEDFVRRRFERVSVLRLPGLFGAGLKKNVVYDFLHGNRLEAVHQDGVFQFYSLEHLWDDVTRVRAAGLELVNLATEPVSVRDVARRAFGFEFENDLPPPAPRYDFRTKHAALWGERGPYAYDRERVLGDLERFVRAERLESSGNAGPTRP